MAKKIKPKLGRSFGSIINDDTQISHKNIVQAYATQAKADDNVAIEQKPTPPVEVTKPETVKTFTPLKEEKPVEAKKVEPVKIFTPEKKEKAVEAKRPEPIRIFTPEKKQSVKTKKPEPLPSKMPDSDPKIFSDFYSIVQQQENLLDVIKIIGTDKFNIASVFKQYKRKDFNSLHDTFLQDETKGKKVFDQILKDETKNGIGLLKELSDIVEKKHADEEDHYDDLTNKKAELYSLWSNLAEEKKKLQDQNKKMTVDLDEFLEKKRWLNSKRDYINYKYKEYGDENRINELFQEWSEEYDNVKAEEESLRAEYEKVIQDEKTLPRLCSDTKKEIKNRRDEIEMAKYEVQEILKAFPDIEERARESEDVVVEFRTVHKNLEENTGVLNSLSDNHTKVDNERKELERNLSIKKEALDPFLKTEYSLKNELTEITNRFNRQEELKEEQRVLKDVVKPLEKTIEQWKDKIKNYEEKAVKMNKEIEELKEESQKIAAEVKEYEALVGPVRELKEKLTGAEKEMSRINEQDTEITKAIHQMRKDNEILSIKAKQFEMVKKKLEGM